MQVNAEMVHMEMRQPHYPVEHLHPCRFHVYVVKMGFPEMHSEY